MSGISAQQDDGQLQRAPETWQQHASPKPPHVTLGHTRPVSVSEGGKIRAGGGDMEMTLETQDDSARRTIHSMVFIFRQSQCVQTA